MIEERLDRPNCALYYRRRESRSGKWAVFLHGAGMDGHMFDGQFSAIPPECGIICWDARGHGQSALDGPIRFTDMLEDLRAILKLLSSGHITLIGQSMGGNLAQRHVAAHPHTVERLILIDCTANHGPVSALERLALRSMSVILGAYPWNTAVHQSARASGQLPSTVAYAETCLRRMGKERFIEVMSFWHDTVAPDPTYRLSIPTLALLGDHDHSGNIAKALTRLAATDPQVRLVTLIGAGHNSNMDRPEEANDAIAAFLALEDSMTYGL